MASSGRGYQSTLDGCLALHVGMMSKTVYPFLGTTFQAADRQAGFSGLF